MQKKQTSNVYKQPVREYQNTLIILLAIIITIEIAIIVYRKYHHTEIIIRDSDSKLSSQKLDINSANIEELESIPGISGKLAKNIITYRENYHRRFPSRKAFKQPKDLLKIKGFTRKILSRITKFITFSATKSDSY